MIEIDPADVPFLPGMRLASAEEWRFPRDADAFIQSLLAPKAKRVRRPTIRQIEKESGRVVTAVTVAPDGSRTYVLGEKAGGAELNEWDQEDLGTHPPQIRQ